MPSGYAHAFQHFTHSASSLWACGQIWWCRGMACPSPSFCPSGCLAAAVPPSAPAPGCLPAWSFCPVKVLSSIRQDVTAGYPAERITEAGLNSFLFLAIASFAARNLRGLPCREHTLSSCPFRTARHGKGRITFLPAPGSMAWKHGGWSGLQRTRPSAGPSQGPVWCSTSCRR